MYDIAILGGDIRQTYMAEIFRKAGLSVITYSLTHPMIQDICVQGRTLKETISSSNILISAIPFSKDGTTIPSLTSASDMNVDCFLNTISRGQILFAGMISPKVKQYLQKTQIEYFDFMEDDSIAIANGIATAEGAIMEAIIKSPGNLHKSHCLVLGFGRCAKTLAIKLKGLEANVCISARKASDLALSKALGFDAVPLNNLKDTLSSFDYIFNSIPALVLDACLLNKVSKDVVIIDIASAPGGLDYQKAKELSLNASLCLGIPGKVSPKASAQILADKVFDHLSNRKKG